MINKKNCKILEENEEEFPANPASCEEETKVPRQSQTKKYFRVIQTLDEQLDGVQVTSKLEEIRL
jgi:hypothetical protein